jgi:predicted Ser/Thr protein kinase
MIDKEEILFSKYQILKVLKKSEKTRVLLTVDPLTDTRRIIKEIRKDEEGLESLQSESLILKNLNHPGIPRFYAMQETKHHFYIVEEYIEGKNLAQLIEQEGCLSLPLTVSYALKLTGIVRYLHEKNPDVILHLDIQPKNVIIHQSGVSLIDFGNAVNLRFPKTRRYLKGTRGFAAPEQYQGAVLNERADIYGIGACISYMLTGIRGKQGIARTPIAVRAIIQKCMEENPQERFENAAALEKALLYLKKSLWEEETDVRKQEQKEISQQENGMMNHSRHSKNLLIKQLAGRVGLSEKMNIFQRRDKTDMGNIVEQQGLYNIGIIGIDKGEGVTSLAVGLSVYLHDMRCQRTAMIEMNGEGEFNEIRRSYYGSEYEENPFEIFKVRYYPGVTKSQYAQICNMGYDFMVTDFGYEYKKSMEDFLRCDMKIVMGSINLWKYRKYLEFHEYTKNFPGVGNWKFLLSGDEDDIRMIRAKHGIGAINKQFFMNPYHIAEQEIVYYEKILAERG